MPLSLIILPRFAFIKMLNKKIFRPDKACYCYNVTTEYPIEGILYLEINSSKARDENWLTLYSVSCFHSLVGYFC